MSSGKFKEGIEVEVLEGIYEGKKGRVEVLANNVPKSVGVRIGITLVWFKPEQIKEVE